MNGVRCIETSTNDNKINFLGYLRAVIVTSGSEEIELRHCGGLLAGWGPARVYIDGIVHKRCGANSSTASNRPKLFCLLHAIMAPAFYSVSALCAFTVRYVGGELRASE
jgi:hypothetical protein